MTAKRARKPLAGAGVVVIIARTYRVVGRCTRGGVHEVNTEVNTEKRVHTAKQCQTVPEQCQNTPSFLIDTVFDEVS